jgi:hypothetical protein
LPIVGDVVEFDQLVDIDVRRVAEPMMISGPAPEFDVTAVCWLMSSQPTNDLTRRPPSR